MKFAPFLFALGGLAPAAAAQCTPAEIQQLVGSGAVAGDEGGYDVAVSGPIAVVGARFDGQAGLKAGAAYVFLWDGSEWAEVKKLLASDGAAGDEFGYSVAADGDVVAVGAVRSDHGGADSGAAYLFERDLGGPNAWGERKKLPGQAPGDAMGWTVLVKGDMAIMGAVYQDPGGVAHLLERDLGGPGNWGLVKQLTASDADLGDRFTRSMALDGDTLLIAADGNDDAGSSSGSAYVFERDLGGPDNWGERKKLTASDPDPVDHFGMAVGLVGDVAVIAAHLDDEAALDAGAVYVHERDLGGSDSWGERAKLMLSTAAAGDFFGRSLGYVGDTFVAGAIGRDAFTGAAFVFRRDDVSGSWSEVAALAASDGQAGDFLGWSVGFDGVQALVGAPQQAAARGAGYAFGGFESGSPSSYCTAGVSASGCTATLSVTGTPSATARSGFMLAAAGVEGQKDGLFFFGSKGRQAAPWGNGSSTQCVVPPVSRAGVLLGSGSSGACDGAFAQDLNALWCPACPKPQKNPGPGAVVQAQLWHRDPGNTSNQTTGFSDAVEFAICP